MFIKISYLILSLLISTIAEKERIKNDFYATLSIPSLHLEKTIYQKDSKYNQLKYGLYLLPESTDITEENAALFLASHSGNAKISYFKNIDKLKINDEIRWIQKNEIYLFRVINIEEAKKEGQIKMKQYKNKTLSLITCKRNTSDLHLIVSAIYIGKIEKNTKNASFFDKIRIFYV